MGPALDPEMEAWTQSWSILHPLSTGVRDEPKGRMGQGRVCWVYFSAGRSEEVAESGKCHLNCF